jgi:hypothetical protein
MKAMKKLYALLVCMFLFAVTCVAVQSVNSRWEKLDGDVIGGTCYVEASPTDTCEDETKTCGDMKCVWNSNQGRHECKTQRALTRLATHWSPMCREVEENENGYRLCTSTTIQCHLVDTCNQDETAGCQPKTVIEFISHNPPQQGDGYHEVTIYVCNSLGTSKSRNKTHYCPPSNATSCQSGGTFAQ